MTKYLLPVVCLLVASIIGAIIGWRYGSSPGPSAVDLQPIEEAELRKEPLIIGEPLTLPRVRLGRVVVTPIAKMVVDQPATIVADSVLDDPCILRRDDDTRLQPDASLVLRRDDDTRLQLDASLVRGLAGTVALTGEMRLVKGDEILIRADITEGSVVYDPDRIVADDPVEPSYMAGVLAGASLRGPSYAVLGGARIGTIRGVSVWGVGLGQYGVLSGPSVLGGLMATW